MHLNTAAKKTRRTLPDNVGNFNRAPRSESDRVDLGDSSEWPIVEETLRGVSVLWVYQTKIIALPPEERWKPIPLLFAEQKIALKILMSGKFRRPIPKTMRKRFGEGITLYGGRKGFSDLMLSLGQKLENISVWMGHATLNRTWTSYKDKKRFHLNFA